MKNPLSIKLLYLLTRIFYWLLFVVIGIVIFAGSIMITLDPQQMELGFFTNLSLTQEVTFFESDPGFPVEVELSADVIEIPVKYLDTPTKCFLLFMALLWLVCLLFILRYVKQFLKKVTLGQTFQSESIKLLKSAGISFIVLESIELLSATFGHFYVKNKFDLGDLSYEFSWEILSSNLIMALTLWSLAHIFLKGKELEEEQKLTV